MTKHHRDQRRDRPKIRVTDKRRVHPDSETHAGEEPLGSSSVTRGVSSEDPRGSSDEAPGASPEETPSVDEGDVGGAPAQADAGERASEYLADLKRLKAEFENYRKRVLREQTRALELAAEPLVAKLLEVVDEFELALMAAEAKPDFDRFLHGVELVYAKLMDILRSEGLDRIEAEDRPFDPERHEALLQAEGEADGEPYVADVLRAGYTLKGRVIRPAGVRVGRRAGRP
jgi:molecular chaperone GrpE